jgi:hypothetical protein
MTGSNVFQNPGMNIATKTGAYDETLTQTFTSELKL